MKKTILTMMMLVLAGMAFAQTVTDGRTPKSRRDGGFPSSDAIVRLAQNPKMVEKLGITPEQSARLAELSKDGRASGAESQKKLRAAMENQANLLKVQPIDEAAVMTSIDEVFELRKATAKAQMKKFIAVRTILTPDQIEKAREAMKELRSRKGEGRSARGSRGKGKSKAGCEEPNVKSEK